MQLSKLYWLCGILFVTVIVLAIVFIPADFRKDETSPATYTGAEWNMPDINSLPATPEVELIRYGKELIVNTSFYLGPKGTIARVSNGMNCENCHLDAGTRYEGNNYSAVFSTYPKVRGRSGAMETIYKRVNDCLQRSLNGKDLDSNSREMHAIYCYIKWLGINVPKQVTPEGAGIVDLPFMDRAADPAEGKIVYVQKCQRCHAADGEGVFNIDSTGYEYPPLWGSKSYNTGAGLFRLSRFAGYVKYNMPYDAKDSQARPSTEEAWDVAAFVNTQPRPTKKFINDWPDISKKPFDEPFGPYTDNFTEQQHKFGPFAPIVKAVK
jgi:thiosulfate dehydrogenase